MVKLTDRHCTIDRKSACDTYNYNAPSPKPVSPVAGEEVGLHAKKSQG